MFRKFVNSEFDAFGEKIKKNLQAAIRIFYVLLSNPATISKCFYSSTIKIVCFQNRMKPIIRKTGGGEFT